MTIGTVTSSEFSGSPEGLSRKRIKSAGPEYFSLSVIAALNATGPFIVQSLCACPCAVAIKLSFGSRTCIGNTASKYQPFGATPAISNDCPTVEPECGKVTVTLAESGSVEDAAVVPICFVDEVATTCVSTAFVGTNIAGKSFQTKIPIITSSTRIMSTKMVVELVPLRLVAISIHSTLDYTSVLAHCRVNSENAAFLLVFLGLDMQKKLKKNVVVLGGGTGTFTVLTGLKKYPFNLTAIVAMSDNGGSTGVLRDELGVLPPGDVRRCLIALSTSDQLMRNLMDYRFEKGGLKGLSFGNLLLSALEKVTGSFDEAVEKVSDILRLKGHVAPATLDPVHLMAEVGSRIVRGEEKIQMTKLNGSLKRLWLEPTARANPKALKAIKEADAIIIGPGNLYASLIPNLLVNGIPAAIKKSKAKKIFVCSLMTKVEHTKNFSVADYTATIEKYLGSPLDIVIYNNKKPSEELLARYARVNDTPTSWNDLPDGPELIGANLHSKHFYTNNKIGTPGRESSLVRHDPAKLAEIIGKILDVEKISH